MAKKTEASIDKPNFPRFLFWEYRFDYIRWRQDYTMVMTRVLERGDDEEYEELIRFYGKESVVRALKNKIKYFPDYILERIIQYFALQVQDLKCYVRKQQRKGNWI